MNLGRIKNYYQTNLIQPYELLSTRFNTIASKLYGNKIKTASSIETKMKILCLSLETVFFLYSINCPLISVLKSDFKYF